MKFLFLCAISAAASLCPSPSSILHAQTESEWIGLTAGTPLIVSTDQATCIGSACIPRASLPFPPFTGTSPAGGGTAWEGSRSVLWVSNGLDLAAFDALRGCGEVCPPHRPLAPGISITGLAVHEPSGSLVLSDSADVIHSFRISCPLAVETSPCRAPIPPHHDIGGIACSDAEDLVFYTSSDFTPSPTPENTLYVAPLSDPCRVLCSVRLPLDCNRRALAPIHGVAYDACARIVWVTDGVVILGMSYTASLPCFRFIRCCEQTSVLEPYIGLCIKPSQSTLHGRPCTSLPCRTCPSLLHTLEGDSLIGNPSFALKLEGAPAGSAALLALNIGPPVVPGITIPPLCGPLVIPLFPAPLFLGPFPAGGTPPCGGSVTVPAPIPPDLFYCDVELVTQFIGFCPAGAGGLGSYVSAARAFRLTSS